MTFSLKNEICHAKFKNNSLHSVVYRHPLGYHTSSAYLSQAQASQHIPPSELLVRTWLFSKTKELLSYYQVSIQEPFVISNYIIVSIRNPFLRGHQIGWLWTLDRSNELSVPLNLLLVLLNLVPSHSFTSESTYGSIKLIITFQILISCVRHSAYLSPGLIHLWNVTGHITRRKNSDFIDSGLPSVSLSLFPFTFLA